MGNSIEELYDYDLVKKCCRCKNILLKSNFHKNRNMSDGFQPKCKFCTQKYFVDNHDRLVSNQRLYAKQNRDKINTRMNDYIKIKKESSLNFKLAGNLRSTTYQASKSQNVRKINKTFDLLGCSHLFFQDGIVHHLDGNETLENYGSVWQIDHYLPIASFNLLDETEMKKSFNWINLRPMYSNENNLKKGTIDYHLYLLQEVKAYQFIKLNDQEGLK